ncbi:MAG TPA: hypothetical protein GX702_14800, partial [Chloroflexi bacterium]|nr:hypothetical protein [Chloroflexota bacterium]
RDSLGASYLHMAYRGMAVVLVAMADGMLKALPGGDDVDSLRGALRRAPLATAALLVGGLSLAGLPPFAGFGTRFSIYRVLATEHPAWVLVVLACSIGPAWSFIRCFVETLRPERSPAEGRRENLFPALLTLPLTLGLGLLGLAPQLLTLLPVPWFDLVTRGPLLLGH